MSASVLNDRLLRIKSADHESVTSKVGLSVSRIYELMKAGEFPQPTTVGGAKLWSEREIDTWIAAQLKTRTA